MATTGRVRLARVTRETRAMRTSIPAVWAGTVVAVAMVDLCVLCARSGLYFVPS